MALPGWFGKVCPQPQWWGDRWKQPSEIRSRRARYAVRTDGNALFALRLGDKDHGPPVPAKQARAMSGWLRYPAPLRVSSRALLDFLTAADIDPGRQTTGFFPGDMAPISIGEDIYNARLLLRDLSKIEDWPAEVRMGWTAPCIRTGGRKFWAVLIAAPRWRYFAMPLDAPNAECWRLEDAVEVIG